MSADSPTLGADVRRDRHDAAVDSVAAGLVHVERGQLRLPRCISEIAVAIDVVDRLLRSGLVVVLTSSQELIDHVAAWWNRAHPDAHYLLTGRSHGSSGLPRDALFTTGSEVVSAWAAAERAGLRVLVGQHRHAELIGEGLLKAGAWADLLVVHEAQYTAGYAKRRAPVHDGRVLPAAARLYTTAAPRIFMRPEVPPADPDEVALSMDEEEVFGPVLHEYSAEQAIIDGAATRVRINPSAPRKGDARVFSAHRGSRRTVKVRFAEALTRDDKLMPGEDSSCCVGNEDPIAITIAHPGATNPDITVTIASVAETTDNSWTEVLRTHPGVGNVLRALREWDPAFGRALDAARAHGPDSHAELFSWIATEPSPTVPCSDEVLAALVAAGADDWWIGYGHLAAHRGRTGSTIVPVRHTIDGYPLGQWLRSTHTRHGLPLDRYTGLRALGATTVTQFDVNRQRRWDRHIATATAFRARYGHLDVDLPGTGAPKDFRTWVSLVRRGHWPVTETERATLDALGMLWDSPSLLRRKAVAAAFAEHHVRHGNLDLPDDLVVEVRGDRTRLVNWVVVFREEHSLGTLHPDVRRTLQGAGFVFEPDEAWWQDLISAARQYHELHGDLDVAPGTVHTAAGECLFTALRNCRSRWRRRSLDDGRASTLSALDPLWGTIRTPPNPPEPQRYRPTQEPIKQPSVPRPQRVPTASAAWQAGLEAAWRHRNRFGHLVAASDYRDPVTGLHLMYWLSAQRRAFRRRQLTAEQIAALDALGMIWDPAAAFRRIGIRNARAYRAEHGHLRVPTTAPFYGRDTRGRPFNLYTALARARRDHAEGTLHPDWRQALDELGYDFAAERTPLSEHIAALEQHHAKHGHLDIPPDHPVHTSLKRVNNAHGRSAIPETLQRRLDDIGYGQEARFTDWDDVFPVVKQFYDKHGHIDVPPDLRAVPPRGGKGTLVRPWLHNQRRRARAGRITRQQKEKLESVGFIWDTKEAEWMEKYRLACRFHEEHGHLAVTKTHVRENRDWAPLPGWLRTQVKLHAAQRLADKRVALLDRIGMLWVERPGHEYQWEQRLQQVDAFRRTHGHTHIYAHLNRTTDSNEHAELKKIAAWLNDQLVYARRGTLRADRRARLAAIGIAVTCTKPRRS